jgi:signal peptidase I
VVQNFQVEGSSMEPTLESRWYLLVNKALYWEINLKTVEKFLPFIDPGDDPTRYLFRGPRRGDIIVFRAPDQTPGTPERDFIKRIIGLPGETVEVRACTVHINNEPLDEDYVKERPNYTWGPETVPEGHYFVLGDNRNNSSDSHTWGMLPKENIIGQASVTYWPFSVLGLVNNTSVRPGEVNEGSAAEGPVKQADACPSGS